MVVFAVYSPSGLTSLGVPSPVENSRSAVGESVGCWVPLPSCGENPPPIYAHSPAHALSDTFPPHSSCRLVPVWGFLAGQRSGSIRSGLLSVQNAHTPSGAASNRLVMSLSSEEIPNSISNKTLQAMLAIRRRGSLERFQLVPNEEGATRPPPCSEDFDDPSFRETMMDMFLQHGVGEPGPAEEREDYKARLERLVPFPTGRERAWASVLDLVAFDSFADPELRETMNILLERGPEEQEDYKARLDRRVPSPTERERAWAAVLDVMAYESLYPIKEVLRLGGQVGPALKETLESEMQFELMGVHHAAQPDTDEARAFRRMQEKRRRFTKLVVALEQAATLELFQVALVHVQDAARECKAVRQINSDRGLKSQEPDVLRKALKAGSIKRCDV